MNNPYTDLIKDVIAGLHVIIDSIEGSDTPELHLPQLNNSIIDLKKMAKLDKTGHFTNQIVNPLLSILTRLKSKILRDAN